MGQIASSRINTFSTERTLFVVLTCLVGAFLLLLAALHPLSVLAQAQDFGLTPGTGIGEVGLGQTRDIKSIIALIINIALGFLGIIAVILILYAGFLWMTAHGNEEQVGKAKLILRNAAIGLVIILSAWGIAAFVINQLQGATTGTGAGDGTDGRGGGVGGGLPEDRFTLEEYQTSHDGKTSADDVYRCSNIQTRFNHWLDATSVASSTASVKAIQKQNSAGQKIDAVLSLAADARNNALILERRNNDDQTKSDKWPANSQIEIQVPKSLTDADSKPLVDCTALGCNDNGGYYGWLFNTTDKEDQTAPALTTAYPPLRGDKASYPARDVARAVTFTLNFSEAIDARTVLGADNRLIADNIKVEQIKSNADLAAVAAIPSEHWDASVSATGVRFSLNRAHQDAAKDGPYLEPFAWYRVTVRNIKDLCNNALTSTQGRTVTWIFQTNGNAPGVAFTYPADKYQFACPSTETFVQFKTSMYDVKNSSCAVNPTNGGLVLAGTGIAGRTLVAQDNVPSGSATAPINPNNYCKRYDFGSRSAPLVPDTTYNPNVEYRNPANDAQTEKTNWSFTVKPAAGCVNTPYISRISPGDGPWGRCLTISGNYFGPAQARGSGGDGYLDMAEDSGRNGRPANSAWPKTGFAFNIADSNWFDTYLTGIVPRVDPDTLVPPGTDGDVDFKVAVKRPVTVGGSAQVLTSNIVPFVVHRNLPAYQGPCLSSISPGSGAGGTNVVLAGTNFGATAGTVTFSDRMYPAAASSWADVKITTAVPQESVDGLVQIEANGKLSNGLPFDVFLAAGGICRRDDDCAAGLGCRKNRCADPALDRFSIRNPQPASACTNSCPDAVISFEASKNIKPNTIKEANIKLLQCADEKCAAGNNIPTGVTAPAAPANRVEIAKKLAPNNWYQVTVLGGPGGLADTNGELLAEPSYSWKFKTGTATCGVNRIELSPAGGILYSAASYEYRARAYSNANSCGTFGQQVSVDFSWNDAARTPQGAGPVECVNRLDEARLSVNPLKTGAGATATVAAFANNDREEHLAWVCVNSGAVVAGAPVTLKPRCAAKSDCVVGECAAECNQQTKACEPTITNFSPANGDISTWVTVNGCYLGNDWGEVKFNGANAVPPDNNFCASTWSNTQIVAEIAPGTKDSGPVEVKRSGDNRSANSGAKLFTVNASVYPAICRAQPNSGRTGTEFTLFGKNFGSSQAVTDKLTASSTKDVISVVNKSWSETTIKAVVPAMEAAGAVELRVNKDQQASNSITFTVTTLAAAPLTVVSYVPGTGDLACPAIAAEAIVNGKLKQGSLAGNFYVRLAGKTEALAGTATSTIFGSYTNIIFKPADKLTSGTAYEIVLKTGKNGLQSAAGGALATDDVFCQAGQAFTQGECVIGFITIDATDKDALKQCEATGNPPPNADPLTVVSYIPSVSDLACPAIAAEAILNGKLKQSSLAGNFYVRRRGGAALPGAPTATIFGSLTYLTFKPTTEMILGTAYEIVFKTGKNGLQSLTGGVLASDNVFCPANQGFAQGECVIGFTTIGANDKDAQKQCGIEGATTPPERRDPLVVASYIPGVGNLACPATVPGVALNGRLKQSSLAGNFYVRRSGTVAPLPGASTATIFGSLTYLTFKPTDKMAPSTAYEIVLKAGASGLKSATGGTLHYSNLCIGGEQSFAMGQECVIGFITIDATDKDALKQCEATGNPPPNADPLTVVSYIPSVSDLACPAIAAEAILNGKLKQSSLAGNFYVRRRGGAALPGAPTATIFGSLTYLTFKPTTEMILGTAYEIVFKTGKNGLQSLTGGVLASDNVFCPANQGFAQGECVIGFTTISATDKDALKQCGIEGATTPPERRDPLVVASASNVDNACPAMIAEAVLNGKLNIDSLKNNFYVRRADPKEILSGWVNAYDYGAAGTRLTFAPEFLMAPSTAYEIVLKAGASGLKSATGGTLRYSNLCIGGEQSFAMGQECVIGFTTIDATDKVAEAQCEASGLTIQPDNPTYYCAGRNDCENDSDKSVPGNQRVFVSRVEARNGQSLAASAPFTWAVDQSPPAVLAAVADAKDTIKQNQVFTLLPQSGESILNVSATIGGKPFKAATTVRVMPCDNPWPPYPGTPFIDNSASNGTNFSTYYCRDKGAAGPDDDLPALQLQIIIDGEGREIWPNAQPPQATASHTAVPGLIKEFLYTVPRTDTKGTDAIGIRVMQNSEHRSISEWYSRQPFNKGTPQAITVDGYKALRDGRTVYVMAPNDRDGEAGSSGRIYTNIYLLSVSDGAMPETTEILNQLLANWHLAANIIKADNRSALRRDTARLGDLRLLADIVEDKAKIGKIPVLASGSFVAGFSTSVWPSWQGALTADLGRALPRDPSNSISCAPDYGQTTCFDKSKTPAFKCSAGNIYQYKYAPGATPDFTLKANLEYQAASWAHPAGSRWRAVAGDSCVNILYGQ